MPYSQIISQQTKLESLDNCFQVISVFLDALQKNFKEDTRYAYPLMPPQANTLLVLDEEVAAKMLSYISTLMREYCGFDANEFGIQLRLPAEAGGLCKLRVDFKGGIDFPLIEKISAKSQILEERLLQSRHSN